MLVSDYNGTVEIAQQAKRKKSYYQYTIPAGFALSSACIAGRALRETNKADTFIKTAKNCMRDYTMGNKKDLSFFLGNRINRVNNKIMFPLIFIAGGLTNGLFIDWIVKVFKRN